MRMHVKVVSYEGFFFLSVECLRVETSVGSHYFSDNLSVLAEILGKEQINRRKTIFMLC